jgi:hypothetical protein
VRHTLRHCLRLLQVGMVRFQIVSTVNGCLDGNAATTLTWNDRSLYFDNHLRLLLLHEFAFTFKNVHVLRAHGRHA